MKRLPILMALLILPSMALAQGARYDGVAQKTVQGFIAPIAGATITVCTSSATGTPCSPLVTTSPVTLCTDATCTVAASNPFLADANGNFGFWATPGSYKVSITAAGVTGQLLTVTLPCAAGISCVSTSSNNTFTGNNTHSGTETFNGTLNSNSLSSGNVANKAFSADSVIFVSSSGSDANDGLSMGTAKLTVAAACAALPSGNSSCSSGSGTVWVAPSFSGSMIVPPNSNCSAIPGGASGCVVILDWRNGGMTVRGPVLFNSTVYTSGDADQKYILQNSDFENTGNNILPPPGWVLDGTPTVNYETSTPFTGKTVSMKITANATGQGLKTANFYSVRPGDGYFLSVAMKSDGTATAIAEIVFTDKNDVQVGQVSLLGTNSTSWVTQTASGVVPANAVASDVYLLDITTIGTVWFDEVTVKNISTTMTLKKGSGAGNYTNATTSYTVADATNLCYTVTIPTGWKLGISASGYLSTATAAVVAQAALTDNAACSTANAGVLVETAPIQGAGIGVADGFALNWVITGDGAAHNIALQFKTSNAADTASLINSSATVTPTIKFELMPSN